MANQIVVFEVKELLVNAQFKAGKYNAESYYGHVVVNPKEAMIISCPVSELGTLKTVQEAIGKMNAAVAAGLGKQFVAGGNGDKGVIEAVGVVGSPLVGVGQEETEDF
jgi:hypothetical protein